MTFSKVSVDIAAVNEDRLLRCVRSVHSGGAGNDGAGRFLKDEDQEAAPSPETSAAPGRTERHQASSSSTRPSVDRAAQPCIRCRAGILDSTVGSLGLRAEGAFDASEGSTAELGAPGADMESALSSEGRGFLAFAFGISWGLWSAGWVAVRQAVRDARSG